MLLDIESHPTWVCGLKRVSYPKKEALIKVTPYVGVWIETDILLEDRARQYVTPYVGVWIETFLSILSSMRCASHTLRGCVD